MERVISLMLEVEEEAKKLKQAADDNAQHLISFTKKRLSEIEQELMQEIDAEVRFFYSQYQKKSSLMSERIRSKSRIEMKLEQQELEQLVESLRKEIVF